MLNLMADEDWVDGAVCAQTDRDAFFPEKGGSTREAKRVCAGCDVREQCLEFALRNDERFGIWGGYSERERRRIKRGEKLPPPTGKPVTVHPDGHGFARWRRGCTCDVCTVAGAQYHRDYKQTNRSCNQCGAPIALGDRRQKYCSDTCKNRAQKQRIADGTVRQPSAPAPVRETQTCSWCSAEFAGCNRSGPRYCSSNCRVKAYNHRKKAAA